MLDRPYLTGEAAFSESTLERLAFRPTPLWLLLTVMLVGAALAIGFGAIVKRPSSAGRLGAIAVSIADIPHTLRRAIGEGAFRPYSKEAYLPQPGGFRRNAAQPFADPGYVLLTAYDERRARPIVRLMRLRDGAVVHDYAPDVDAINARSTFASPLINLKRDRNARDNLMMHPLLMPDGGLIIHDTSPLARVDACGRVLWMIDGIFHHAVERGPDGSIWAAYRYPHSPDAEVSPTFNDEAIMNVSPGGRILSHERVADILDRNGLGETWRSRPYNDDPFHLNDVQPVFADGPYWRRGDLFLSLRNMSTILLYRPSTGRVLWSRTGPWSFQHDVTVLDDHRVIVFDNNWRFAFREGQVDGLNRVALYDFASGAVTFPNAAGMRRNAIRTRAQGRATPMPNGDMMIEETDRGRLMRMAPDGTLRWRYIAADSAMRRYELRWSRYLDMVTDGGAIRAAANMRCT